MPKVTYRTLDGAETTVEVASGKSVMLGALTNNIDGIEAECGGSCMCATCHVYVDEAWVDKVPAMQILEEEMLEDTAAERLPNSRLSCQIEMSDDLDGLVVTLPETQV